MQVRKKKEDIKELNESFAEEQFTKLTQELSQYRQRLGVSLADLSIKTQTYPSYIHRVETGQVNTTVKKMMVILDAMGLELKIQPKEGVDLDSVAKDLRAFNKSH